MPSPLLIAGTGSDAGKSTLVAGFCRYFANQGLRVAPFKSQNMALNCFVTEQGEEIARATAVQAIGARAVPNVHMNPLLLKPKSEDVAQLIVHGKVVRDIQAKEYFFSDDLQELKLNAIRESIAYLKSNYDLIVAEGAGSCAEPNLRKLDVVNFGAAHLLGARVIIAADVAQGGAFASLLGTIKTIELTEPKDLPLVAGFLLNKFRGDRDILQPAIDFIEQHTKLPMLDVLPYLPDLALEEEDRVKERRNPNAEIDIAVVYLPHIANANDFDFLADEQGEAGVQVRYVRRPDDLGLPDAILIPGTKNTIGDLQHLRKTGFADRLIQAAQSGRTVIMGICGGYQMLARTLHDPDQLESEHGTVPGLNLLDIEVHFAPKKITTNRTYTPTPENPFATAPISGYEIHCGTVHYGNCSPLYTYAVQNSLESDSADQGVQRQDNQPGQDGATHPSLPIYGTFIHDIFRNPTITRSFINSLRQRSGLAKLVSPLPTLRNRAEPSYELLARSLSRTAKACSQAMR